MATLLLPLIAFPAKDPIAILYVQPIPIHEEFHQIATLYVQVIFVHHAEPPNAEL